MIFRFGAFELDEAAGELRRDGAPVRIQPKPLALLALLVRERERVVPTEELFERLWTDTAVSPSSLTRAVSHARRAIGDTHRGETIRSYARRGYRFCANAVELGAAEKEPADARPAAGNAGADPFVGRAGALATLTRAWEDAAGGRGRCVLVSGPAGIGKTRLVEVFADRVAQRGGVVAVARGHDGDGVPAFWLWAQVFRQLAARRDFDSELGALARSVSELTGLVPELAAGAEPVVARSDLSPQQTRFLMFDDVVRTLSACSRKAPLLLVLEDLQWARPPSLLLLEHLAAELEDRAVLLVCTVRDGARDRGQPVQRALANLRRLAGCEPIALAGFTRGEVAELLERVLGGPAAVDVTSEVVARTEGVPLFVREAIRLLAARGDLAPGDRSRRGIALPDRALDLIRRSLDGLSEPAAALVGAASVLGRVFAVPFACEFARVDREDALDRLDEATAAGIVEPDGGATARYRFSHALFQEAMYESLSAGERTRLHARAAARLEEQFAGDLDRVIAELAHHHHHGIALGDPERAYEVAMRAARRASASLAYEQAATHYEQAVAALDHAESADPRRRLETLLALGDAYRVAGERIRRLEVFTEAMSAARALELDDAFARAAVGFFDITEWSGVPRGSEAVLREALERHAPGPSPERARLTTRLAYMIIHDQPRSIPLARKGLEFASETGDPEAIQEARYVLHYAISGPEHFAERAALVDDMRRSATGSGRDVAMIALLDVSCDQLALGDRDAARERHAQALALAREAATPTMTWHLRVYDAGVALMEGRLDEVEALVANAHGLGARIPHPFANGCRMLNLSALYRERGAFDEAIALLEPAQRGAGQAKRWLGAVLGRALFGAGRVDEARAAFERIVGDDLTDFTRNIHWLPMIAELSLLCAELEDASAAKRLAAQLEGVAQLHSLLPTPINYAGPLARPLGRLYALLGRSEDALASLDRALDAARAMRARPAEAHVQLDRGALLDRTRQRSAAREALDASLAIADEIGMQAVAGAARAKLASLQ